MSLKAKVKVGHVNNLSAARYCAGMGVDFLGFRMGDKGLNPVAYKEIIDWISGPELILEAHRDQALTLEDITSNYPGHYIEINKDQLHWLESSGHQFILFIEQSDLPFVMTRIEGKDNLKYIELSVDAIEDLTSSSPVPVMLFLRDPRWVELAMQLNVFALSINSGDEERPGLMDYAVVAEVLESLEE